VRTIEKDPSAVLDYPFNWADWLGPAETVSTATFTISPGGLTKDSQDDDLTSPTIWLSAGTLGVTYEVACRITTNQGRTDERTLRVRVVNR
jgi:hypothetical protein